MIGYLEEVEKPTKMFLMSPKGQTGLMSSKCQMSSSDPKCFLKDGIFKKAGLPKSE